MTTMLSLMLSLSPFVADAAPTTVTPANVVTVTGPLVDRYCWETLGGVTLDTQADLTANPLDHTLHCLVEVDVCRESGYVIVADDDSDGTWETKYVLDDRLNEQAIAMMLEDHPDITFGANVVQGSGYTITLTGIDDGTGNLFGGVVDVSAPLVDRYCWEERDGITLDTQADLTANPLDHTLHCLVEVGICRESGYVTVADDDEDGVWETQYILNDALNQEAIDMMVADYPGLIFGGNANIDVNGYTVEMQAFDDTSGTLRSLDEVVTVTGPVVDRYCWETLGGVSGVDQTDLTTNPLNHSIFCILEVPQCRESGFVIVADDDEDGIWETKYTLDDAFNAQVLAMMIADYPDNTAPEYTATTGYTVTLTGRDTGDGILRSLVADDVVMVEGPLVDRYCWETRDGITLDTNVDLTIDPLNHTLHCLVEVDICRESGYVIVAEDEDGIWQTAYILDESQNADVIALMIADFPGLALGGNAGIVAFGYEVVLSGVDYGDGYLRAVDTEVISVTGPLVDRFCWETREGRALDTNANLFVDPLNHTLHCLVEVQQCRESGYLILEEVSSADMVTVTGPLVDRYCWETLGGVTLDTGADLTTNPLNHTLHCLAEVERCRESGYVILAEGDDGIWETAYTLDAVLNEQAIAMMLEDHPDITFGANVVEGSGYTITLTGVDDGNGNLLGTDWQVAYILDDILNGEAIMQIMDDHPEVTLNGNNAPSLGYTLTISGIDNGDGYLRSEFAEEVTTTEGAVETACPDGLANLGAEGEFGDFTVIIEVDCVAATVTMNIQHSSYTEQWLGVVFSDTMIGTALIYTTGNTAGDSEAPRDLGLYQYDNLAKAGGSVNWDDSIEWTEISTDLTDGVLQIEYTAPLTGSPIDLSNLETAQLRWAMGTDSSAITYHGTGRSDDILTLNLLTGASTIEEVSLTAQYAHGVIMWITWAVLASIGIMSSAFRFLYPQGPTWFKIHRGVQISVVVLHLIGFFIAVAFTESAEGVDHFSNDHMKCGLAVTILCCLQPLNAVLRSHPPPGGWKGGVAPVKRQVWEFVHKKSGYIAWILGCVTAFLGMRLPAIDAIGLSEVHMYGWCLCLLLAYLVLSVLKCNNAVKEAEMKSMDMPKDGTDTNADVEMLCAVGPTTNAGTAGAEQESEVVADREDSK